MPFCGRIARHEAEASVLKLHESIVGTKDHSGEILVNKDLALGALRVPFIKNYQRSCRCVALVIGFERYLHVYAEKKTPTRRTPSGGSSASDQKGPLLHFRLTEPENVAKTLVK